MLLSESLQRRHHDPGNTGHCRYQYSTVRSFTLVTSFQTESHQNLAQILQNFGLTDHLKHVKIFHHTFWLSVYENSFGKTSKTISYSTPGKVRM